MAGARDIIRNGLSQTDFNGGGNKLVNWDTTNLVFGSFGVQGANKLYAGPSSGADAIPTFRLVTAAEVGAQPQDAALDAISGSVPTTAGVGLLEIPNPSGEAYPFNNGADAGVWSTLTPAQLRTNILAQPLHANLTSLASIVITTTSFLRPVLPGTSSYTKLNTDGTVSLLTAAQVATDIGAGLAPFIDSTAIVKGSLTAGKLFRIEVDHWAGAVTRVMSPPDYDFVPASLSGAESMKQKVVNGLTLAVGTAADENAAITFTDEPAQPFLFSLIALETAAHLTIRCNGPADVVMPESGKLATIAGTIPSAYLSTKTDMNDGGGPSNTRVSTQLAVYTFVTNQIAQIGAGLGSGKNPDLAVSAADSVKIETAKSFNHWLQIATLAAGAGTYTYRMGLSGDNATEGAVFRVRLEFDATTNPTVEIRSGDPGTGPIIDTIQGVDDSTTVYVFEAVWNGIQWKKYDGHYVI